MNDRSRLQNVLYIAPGGCTGYPGTIGDSLLQEPLVRTLGDRRLFPNVERIEWVCNPIAPVLFQKKGYDSRARFNPWKNPEKTSMPTPLGKCDLAIIAYYDVEDIIDQTKVEDIAGNTPIFTPYPKLNPQGNVHLTRQIHSALSNLLPRGYHPPRPQFSVTEKDVREADKMKAKLGLFEKSYNICHISCGEMEKSWCPESWARLVLLLKRDLDKKAVFTYAPAHRKIFESIREKAKVDVFGVSLSLGGLAALAQDAYAFISPDSGPMQLMAAAGARGINMAAKMNPRTWAPLSELIYTIDRYPGDIKDISPEEVAVEFKKRFC